MNNNFFDNKTSLFGDDLKTKITKNANIQIASSIFSIYGFSELEKELKKIKSLEFIFKDPTFIKRETSSKQEKLFEINTSKLEKAIGGTQFEVTLINEMKTRNIAIECAKWIEQKVKFKTNNTKQLFNNSYFNVLTDEEEYAYINTSDFSSEGFGYQKDNSIAYSITRLENEASKSFIKQFNDFWIDDNMIDVTNEVIDFVKTLYKENAPEYIYYVTLFNIFNEFLEDINEDNLANEKIGLKNTEIYNKLYPFQKDAVNGLINKLETFNGCILADSVGLGKTFTSLAVIKYYELRNKDVLVLCPKKLGNNWNTYKSNYNDNILSKDRFNYDVLYHTDLSRTNGESNGIDLSRINWENYDLVVIDESHNFRNNNARNDRKTRYDILLEEVIKKGIKTKVLMLSATPVNNKFMDLSNQLNLAYEGKVNEINPLISKQKSPHRILKEAQTIFNEWGKLPIEERTSKNLYSVLNKNFEFFKLLDSVTIARSRTHIEKSYSMNDIGKFPTRLKPINKYSEITSISNFINVHEIYEQLAKLNLSVYIPLQYVHSAKIAKYESLYDTITERGTRFRQLDREKSLQTLMRVNMMKRLESSIDSFRSTIGKLNSNIENTLDSIINFENNKNYNELQVDNFIIDDEEFSEFTIGNKVKIELEDMDIATWKIKLNEDRDVLEKLLNEFNKITPDKDSKLIDLKNLVKDKQKKPINEGNKKVIIFTSYADTAIYLYNNMKENGNVALITGSTELKNNIGLENKFDNLLLNFSPKSKSRDIVFPNETRELDILIATDCISEGQNLQDCDYLINYDIHWNPVRIIQRFGRIDRIGSENKVIQLVNFWPNVSIDEYINLKNRVEDRMKILNIASTGSDNVLNKEDEEMEFRKKQLEKLKEEVLDLEEISGSISITDLGLNDFRMDLLEYTNKSGDISNVSNGIHSVISANGKLDKGVIFVLRNVNNDINIDMQNQMHPFYIIYIKEDGKISYNHLQPKEILDLMRNVCREKKDPDVKAYQLFNEKTKDGKEMSKYSTLLTTSIKSIIDVNEKSEIDSLFGSGELITNDIKGLDDFELITFLVII